MRVFAALATILSLAPVALADLEWEKQEVLVIADVGSKSVTGEFVFRNTGERAITIKQAEAACTCSIAAMDKKTYAKGESGKLSVTFEIGDRTGTHIKTITVRTDDPGGWVHRVFLKVRLVEPPTLTPRMVYWSAGEPPTPKTIAIAAGKDEVVHVTAATVDRKLFEAKVEAVEDGKRYTVTITPKDTRKPVAAPIEIQTDWPTSEPRTFKALARIMPKGQAR